MAIEEESEDHDEDGEDGEEDEVRDDRGELMWTGPHNDACEECDEFGDLSLCGYCNLVYHKDYLSPEQQALVSGDYWKCQKCLDADADMASSAADKGSSAASSFTSASASAQQPVAASAKPASAARRPLTAKPASASADVYHLLPNHCTKTVECTKANGHLTAYCNNV